ncbi:MAG TPA: hypothetical protein VJS92_11855, partial [Candidatus Polarisedimenticolaceae bacterium]|nr:hypothetical protein [Candidatus Polarisedimenticolaceae bacterium]
ERARTAAARSIDLGRCAGRWFAGVLAAGFDGEVLRHVEQRPHWLPRGAVYPYAVLRALGDFTAFELRVEADAGSFAGPAMLVAVANSPRFGGGMRVAPQAALDDGWLDLVIVRALPMLRFVAAFPRVYRGRHLEHPAITSFRVRRLRLSADRPLRVHGDGEPLSTVGREGVEVTVAPGALRVVA